MDKFGHNPHLPFELKSEDWLSINLPPQL
jgi:hypothetical protein